MAPLKLLFMKYLDDSSIDIAYYYAECALPDLYLVHTFLAHIHVTLYCWKKRLLLYSHHIIIKSTKKTWKYNFYVYFAVHWPKKHSFTFFFCFVYNIYPLIYIIVTCHLYISEIDIPFTHLMYIVPLLYTVSTLLFVYYKIFVMFTFRNPISCPIR